MTADNTLQLRYVGTRFSGGRIPLDVLPDLSFFQNFIVAIAKQQWFKENPSRRRLPRGFNHSVSFDLIDIEDGSAVPKIQWDRQLAVKNAPEIADEIGNLVNFAFDSASKLFEGVGDGRYPSALPAEQLLALNNFGSSLAPGERIEFVNKMDREGNVIYFDVERRRRLLSNVSDTFEERFTSSGILVTSSSSGYIHVMTTQHGLITIDIPSAIVIEHYDGNMGSDVQFDVRITRNSDGSFKRVNEVLDVTIVDASDTQKFRDAMMRINALRTLETGWFDGSGNAIGQASIRVARTILHSRPDLAECNLGIFPTEDGGLTLEFRDRHWDYTIEVMDAGSLEVYGIDLESQGSLEPQFFAFPDAVFLSKLEELIGRFSKND